MIEQCRLRNVDATMYAKHVYKFARLQGIKAGGHQRRAHIDLSAQNFNSR